MSPMAELGFIIAVTVGAAAGTTDLTDGMFRHLVITGRSRIALFLARIPAGLAILLPVVALAFTLCCLVTSFEGVPRNRKPVSVDDRRFNPRQPQRVAVPDLGSTNAHEKRSRPSRGVRARSSTASRSRVVPPARATTPTPSWRRPSIQRLTRW